jgi:hypothetical protein
MWPLRWPNGSGTVKVGVRPEPPVAAAVHLGRAGLDKYSVEVALISGIFITK